jgi:hypothetical protein
MKKDSNFSQKKLKNIKKKNTKVPNTNKASKIEIKHKIKQEKQKGNLITRKKPNHFSRLKILQKSHKIPIL